MSWVFPNKTYTPLKRSFIDAKPLTPEEVKYILENPYNTGYTYAQSSSYSIYNSPDYIHPNLGRQPNLSSNYNEESFSISRSDESFDKTFFNRVLDTFLYIVTFGNYPEHYPGLLAAIKKGFIPFLLGLGGLLLLLLLLFLAPQSESSQLINWTSLAHPVSRGYDIISYPFEYGWNATKNVLSHAPSTVEDTPPPINEDQYASKFSQLEMELDKIWKEVQSIGAASQEISDAKTSALIDTQMKKIQMAINSLFEKEHEMLRMEKEQLKKAFDQAPTHVHHHHHTNVHVSEEKVAELVQRSLRNVNLTSMVEEAVRYYIQNHSSESERHSTANMDELVKKKINTTIYEALRRLSYDKTGEADFALESAGGSVVSTRSTENWIHHSRRKDIWGIPLWYTSYSPRSVIQRQSQNVNAGECWAVKGAEAYLVIKLARNIDVTAVSYEHLPRELAVSGNIDSAPKNFKIYSLQEENDPNKFLIGEYVYDDNGEPLQRFDAQHHDPRGTRFIEFELHSNHGAAFTCLYRFRVHGNPQQIVDQQQESYFDL